jgi:hypothetical protein
MSIVVRQGLSLESALNVRLSGQLCTKGGGGFSPISERIAWACEDAGPRGEHFGF